MQDAREGFRQVSYSTATGIQTFYNSLLDHAQNMSVLPDDYTILEQFLAGLPLWMALKMFEDFACPLNPTHWMTLSLPQKLY